MKILGLHHVAIAADDLSKYQAVFHRVFGLDTSVPELVSDSNVKVTMVDLGNTHLEIVEPTDPASPISKFLEKRGSGIHHLCILVESITEAIKELKSRKVRMIDEKPRQGASDSLIAFVHPESTGGILIELKEEPKHGGRS